MVGDGKKAMVAEVMWLSEICSDDYDYDDVVSDGGCCGGAVVGGGCGGRGCGGDGDGGDKGHDDNDADDPMMIIMTVTAACRAPICPSTHFTISSRKRKAESA